MAGASFRLLHLFFHLWGDAGDRSPPHLHGTVRPFFYYNAHFSFSGVLTRKIITKMTAPAFFAFNSGPRDRLRNRKQALKVDGGVPTWIVFSMTLHRHLPRPFPK